MPSDSPARPASASSRLTSSQLAARLAAALSRNTIPAATDGSPFSMIPKVADRPQQGSCQARRYPNQHPTIPASRGAA